MKENTLNRFLTTAGVKTGNSVKFLLILCLVIAFGCKSKKQILVKRVAPDSTVKTPDNKIAKLTAVRARQTSFNTFSGKALTKLDISGDSHDVTLNIRIQRDKRIWVSITAIAGIEVARALITPDSIMLINRLQSLYLRKPFSYVNQFAGNQVNYKTLESLLVGNIIPELLNEGTEFQPGTGTTLLSGSLNELVYKLLLGPDMKVTQTNLGNQSAGQSLVVNNSAFIQATNRNIPSQIDMASVVKDKKIQVNLHYIKADFDQTLEYPFSIPSRYNPAE